MEAIDLGPQQKALALQEESQALIAESVPMKQRLSPELQSPTDWLLQKALPKGHEQVGPTDLATRRRYHLAQMVQQLPTQQQPPSQAERKQSSLVQLGPRQNFGPQAPVPIFKARTLKKRKQAKLGQASARPFASGRAEHRCCGVELKSCAEADKGCLHDTTGVTWG